jgi:AraC-like DNA-binding protein
MAATDNRVGRPLSARMTRAPAGDDCLAWWREEVCARFLPLDVRRRGEARFDASIGSTSLGPLRLSRIRSTAQVVRRRRKELALGGIGDIYVLIQLRGVSAVVAQGRPLELRPGGLAVIDTDRPYELIFPTAFDQWCLSIPRDLAAAGERLPPECHGRGIGRGTPVGDALRAQCDLIDRHGERLPPHVGAHIDDVVTSLVATALAGPTARSSAREHKLGELLEFIRMRSWDPALTPGSAARSLGISVRSLHHLLAGVNTTFREQVRARRLAQATALLTGAASARKGIAEIACEVGFQDLSTFNRAFRSRYGMTPSAFRREAAQVARSAAPDA